MREEEEEQQQQDLEDEQREKGRNKQVVRCTDRQTGTGVEEWFKNHTFRELPGRERRRKL